MPCFSIAATVRVSIWLPYSSTDSEEPTSGMLESNAGATLWMWSAYLSTMPCIDGFA